MTKVEQLSVILVDLKNKIVDSQQGLKTVTRGKSNLTRETKWVLDSIIKQMVNNADTLHCLMPLLVYEAEHPEVKSSWRQFAIRDPNKAVKKLKEILPDLTTKECKLIIEAYSSGLFE